MNAKLKRKLTNNPTLPSLPTQVIPPPTTAHPHPTSSEILSSLQTLIDHSDTKSKLVQEVAKTGKPVFALGMSLINDKTYSDARPHLLALIEAMQRHDDVLDALEGILQS